MLNILNFFVPKLGPFVIGLALLILGFWLLFRGLFSSALGKFRRRVGWFFIISGLVVMFFVSWVLKILENPKLQIVAVSVIVLFVAALLIFRGGNDGKK